MYLRTAKHRRSRLPEGAKALLERELDVRNQKGQKILKEALGGMNVAEFIESRRQRIRDSLNRMYRELGMGDEVPPIR